MYKLNVIFIVLFFLSACDTPKKHGKRVLAIGKMIVKLDTLSPETRMIPDVVTVGDGLVQKVSLVKAYAKSYQLKVRGGDLSGESRADYILSIFTDYQNIGIRLKYNKHKDKYDILGWATIRE